MDEKDILKKGYKKYSGDKVDVYFNIDKCEHAGKCVHGNSEVFSVLRKPWILPDESTSEDLIRIIEKCPSGALKYRLKDQDEILPSDDSKTSSDQEGINYRYESERERVAAYDRRKEVGECIFSTDNPKFWTIDHTYVDPDYRGENIAGNLVKNVVEAAKEKKVKIVPICRFACLEFDRKPEYQEMRYKEK